MMTRQGLGYMLLVTAIVSSKAVQGVILDNSASEFYVGFARNDAGGQSSQQLFITTRDPDPVPFTVQTLNGFNFTGIAMSNTTTVVLLDNSIEVLSFMEREKGVYVSAGDKQIVVYGLNFHQFTSDAFLALPCPQLTVDQYEYYGINFPSSFTQSQLLFVGCEDNTTINFASTTIILNQMQTYLVESGVDVDITGTRIVSNKPISFYSGTRCTNIPANIGACDHITEQIPPTATWGTRFLSASFSGRMSGEIYRILASESSTSVTVNCSTYSQPETYSLVTAGAWQEFTTPDDSFCIIESDNPLLVVEFALGNNIDGIGDPFMMMIPPIEQYSNSYVINVLSNFTTNFITMFVTPEFFQPEKIFIDDMSQEQADWITIYCLGGTECGYAAYAGLVAGEHLVFHNDTSARIGVAVYGFNVFNSYGYPGGLQLAPIQLPTVSFSEETYSVLENVPKLNVTVVRSGDINSSITVQVANRPFEGTATVGQDYSTVLAILEFEAGATEKEVEICIIDDEFIEVDETFVLYLSSGTGVFLSPFTEAEVTIINNDGTYVDAQCSESFLVGDTTGGINSSWTIYGEVVTFTVSATTTGWVAIGFSPTADTTNTDAIIGGSDGGSNSFVEDRYLSPTTTVNDEPTVDVSQDIFDTSVSHQGGITTMVFSRTRSSSDPDDISLTECRFIIAARGGTVTYGNPNAISALEELAVTNQEICFPSNCNTGGMGGDPHFSIALHDGKMLCYSVQGRPDRVFNLISCENFLINAQFVPDSKRKGVTWMGVVGVVLKKALKFEGSRVTHFLFDAQSHTVHIGNKISVAADTIQELISVNGTLSVVGRHGSVSPSSQPAVRISLKEEGLEFTIKFEGQHLDLFWHRAVKSKNSHGLIGQFFREGVSVDEVRKLLFMPSKAPVPVEWKPIWRFMERKIARKETVQHCWAAMNPGDQGKGLIDGHYLDYLVEDVLSGGFQFEPRTKN